MMTFKRIEAKDITVDLLQNLVQFCVDYIERSGDAMLMPMQLVDLAQRVAFKKEDLLQFWLLRDEKGVCGYAVTQFLDGEKGIEFNIRQAYIAPTHRNNGAQAFTISEMEKFARGAKCKFMTCETKRLPFEAYVRWMGRVGFQPRVIGLEKPLE